MCLPTTASKQERGKKRETMPIKLTAWLSLGSEKTAYSTGKLYIFVPPVTEILLVPLWTDILAIGVMYT